MGPQEGATLTPAQQAMSDLWDEHTRAEFATGSVEATLDTMVEEPHVNHVPVLTGIWVVFRSRWRTSWIASSSVES